MAAGRDRQRRAAARVILPSFVPQIEDPQEVEININYDPN
jgi:hypothetical protein